MKEAEAPFSTDNGKYTLIQNTDQGEVGNFICSAKYG